MLLIPGSQIKDDKGNEYILNEMLGSGGFGVVYKTTRIGDSAVFAVKTLLPTFNTTQDLQSFKHEINQAINVAHEYVIRYEFIHDGSLFTDLPPYIIMEYASGGTLRQMIEQRRDFLPNDELLQILLQLSYGMQAINRVLIHRDIKPENILLEDGFPKISDFGLSKYADESTRTLTFKGFGSAKYTSPEAWNNGKNTVQMDIYSMGIVFFELATREYPYKIDQIGDIMSIRNAHLTQGITNPTVYNSSIPPKIVSIIIRMLMKPTHERYNDWNEIIHTLTQEAPVDNYLGPYIIKAISKQNDADIETQHCQAEHLRREQEHNDFFGQVSHQVDTDIFKPLESFVSSFNDRYSGTKKMRFALEPTYGSITKYIKAKFTLPSGNWFKLDFEAIFGESYTRQVNKDMIFNSGRTFTESYTPQYDNRNIMAWGQIEDRNSIGFNLMLLDTPGDIYGKWYLMVNSSSGLARERRPSPFGFNLNELPEEVTNLNAMHIYSSEIRPFDIEYLYKFITERLET